MAKVWTWEARQAARIRGQQGWTPERRAEAAERIRTIRPWEFSTGPKTTEGKAVSRWNALKHGRRADPKLWC
jgi:hypothetical protein